MNILPAVMAVIQFLPKVAPTLKALKELFNNEPNEVTNNLSVLKRSIKGATIAVLTLKEVVKLTPSEKDNQAFARSVATLKELRNNLDEVINILEK